MKTHQWIRNVAVPLCLALALGLAGCGGGGGGTPADQVVQPIVQPAVPGGPVVPPVVNPNPPNPGPGITPTVAFTVPAEDIYFYSPINLELTVTGSPDKVELYKNGALETTLTAAPYIYYWYAPGEPEGTYTFTAKTIKSGSSDVTSAPRTIIVDKVSPTLVSRTPLDGARNVLIADEISITLNKPMMASSVDENSVRLYIGQAEILTTPRLDSTGTKIRVAFVRTPSFPATITMVVNGIKDLSGRGVSVPDINFRMVNRIVSGTPTVVLSLSQDRWLTRFNPASVGPRTARVTLFNFDTAQAFNPFYMELFMDGKQLPYTVGDRLSSADCAVGDCYEYFGFGFGDFTTYDNGQHVLKVRMKLLDGTFLESAEVPLTINIPSACVAFPLCWRLLPENVSADSDVGLIGIGGKPFTSSSTYYEPPYSLFYNHKDVIKNGQKGGILEYMNTFAVNGHERGQELRALFRAFYFNSNPSSGDLIKVRSRACSGSGASRNCTVWNYETPSASGVYLTAFPPFKASADSMDVVIQFNTYFGNSQGTAYIGNMFFGP